MALAADKIGGPRVQDAAKQGMKTLNDRGFVLARDLKDPDAPPVVRDRNGKPVARDTLARSLDAGGVRDDSPVTAALLAAPIPPTAGKPEEGRGSIGGGLDGLEKDASEAVSDAEVDRIARGILDDLRSDIDLIGRLGPDGDLDAATRKRIEALAVNRLMRSNATRLKVRELERQAALMRDNPAALAHLEPVDREMVRHYAAERARNVNPLVAADNAERDAVRSSIRRDGRDGVSIAAIIRERRASQKAPEGPIDPFRPDPPNVTGPRSPDGDPTLDDALETVRKVLKEIIENWPGISKRSGSKPRRRDRNEEKPKTDTDLKNQP